MARFEDIIRRTEDCIFTNYNLSSVIFINDPSEDSVKKILGEGYVEVTDTDESKKLLKAYASDKKHGLTGHRVFIKE